MPKYAKHTTIPVVDGFKLVLEKEISTYSEEQETSVKQRRGKFLNQISGQGTYGNISTAQNYNNYQSARRYQNQNYESLER